MGPTASAMLALAMIAAFALVAGGLYSLLKLGERQRGLLMIACAIVIVANVLIWTL